MRNYLKIGDLIKELQEIEKKHPDLDVVIPNVIREQYEFMRDFDVRVEEGVETIDADGDVSIVKRALVIGIV